MAELNARVCSLTRLKRYTDELDPDAVLLNRGPLDAAELALMQEHPVIGDRLCRELRLLEDVRPIVRHRPYKAAMTPDRACKCRFVF